MQNGKATVERHFNERRGAIPKRQASRPTIAASCAISCEGVAREEGPQKHVFLRNEPDWKSSLFQCIHQECNGLGISDGFFQSGSFGTETKPPDTDALGSAVVGIAGVLWLIEGLLVSWETLRFASAVASPFSAFPFATLPTLSIAFACVGLLTEHALALCSRHHVAHRPLFVLPCS